jgi:hypothetical protein
VSSNRDFGVEQFFRVDEFRAVDPSPQQKSIFGLKNKGQGRFIPKGQNYRGKKLKTKVIVLVHHKLPFVEKLYFVFLT